MTAVISGGKTTAASPLFGSTQALKQSIALRREAFEGRPFDVTSDISLESRSRFEALGHEAPPDLRPNVHVRRAEPIAEQVRAGRDRLLERIEHLAVAAVADHAAAIRGRTRKHVIDHR